MRHKLSQHPALAEASQRGGWRPSSGYRFACEQGRNLREVCWPSGILPMTSARDGTGPVVALGGFTVVSLPLFNICATTRGDSRGWVGAAPPSCSIFGRV
jgi:hypothetical protein